MQQPLHLFPLQSHHMVSLTLLLTSSLPLPRFRNMRPYTHDDKSGKFARNPAFSHFPKDALEAYVDLAFQCTKTDPKMRPTFSEIIPRLKVRGP